MLISRRTLLAGSTAAVTINSSRLGHADERSTIRIGVLTDMSGSLRDTTGPGSVAAATLAAHEFAAANPGIAVEVILADHGNKPDVGVGRAREWFDLGGVDAITDIGNSAVALGCASVTADKDKVQLSTSPGLSALTGVSCTPNMVQWTFDSYSIAHTIATAVTATGGKTWFFVTPNYTSVLLVALLAWILEGRRPSTRVLGGAFAGSLGVAAVFADQLGQVGAGAGTGIGLSLAGTALFSLGTLASRRAAAGGTDLLNALARGLAWGTAILLVFVLARGNLAPPDTSPAYLGGLAYLAAVASIGGFFAYLRLAAIVGPERAAYCNVGTPLVALFVSGLLEGYRPSAYALIGVPLVLGGVAVVFIRPAQAR